MKVDDYAIQLKRNDKLDNLAVNFVRNGSAVTVVRTDGQSWTGSGFGQDASEPVVISDSGSGSTNGTYVISLASGSTLTLASGTDNVSDIQATQVIANMAFTAYAAKTDTTPEVKASIQRGDGRDWSSDGFSGSGWIHVATGANAGDWEVESISGTTMVLKATSGITGTTYNTTVSRRRDGRLRPGGARAHARQGQPDR